MKPISLLGAATALAMAATPAFAVNWVDVSSDSTGTIYYYDADTIQRSGNQVTAWEKGDHSRDKTVKQREKKVRYRYDCAEKTSTLLQLTKYYPDGKIEMVTWKTYEQEPQAIVPGTIGELQFEAVCTATACSPSAPMAQI